MPRQNRATPLGTIEALPGRGLLMGNRGVLHDDAGRIVRATQVRRWIACRLEFRGRHREIMQPRRWTELFFLDEAAAFAAGHRPCAECRYADYKKFRALWTTSFGTVTSIDDVDRVLHEERLDASKKRTFRANIASLPDGAFVLANDLPSLVYGDALLEWTDSGYHHMRTRPRSGRFDVLTPRSIVGIIAAGYEPLVHRTAANDTTHDIEEVSSRCSLPS